MQKLTNEECARLSQSDEVWAIRSLTLKDFDTNEPLYWSNEWGWVSGETAQLFTAQDHAVLNLPIGGTWERW